MPIDFVEEATIDFQEEAAPIDFAEDAEYLSTDIAPKENVALQAQQAALRAKDEGGTAVKVLTEAESAASVLENPIGAVLALPENALKAAGVNMPYSSKAPLFTKEQALKAIEFITPGGGGSEGTLTQSVQEFIAETLSTLTSPDMIGYMMAAKKAPVPVGRYFQGEMLAQLPATAAAAAEGESGSEKTKAALGVAANVAFPAMIESGIGKHSTAIKGEVAKQVGPATEAAVKGTTEAPKAAAATEPTPAPVERTTALEAVPAEIEAPKPVVQPESKPVGLGAATPAEFELKPQNPTSIKNAVVDQERAARGLPPAMEPASKEFGVSWEQAMAKMDADYLYPDRLIAEMREKPRAATDTEVATLLHRQVELRNLQDKAMRELAQAKDDGRVEDVADLNVRVDILSNQLLDLFNIDKAVGTENARGLNARKMLANEDFTLAKMELEKRAAKGGEQLTDAERAEVTNAQGQIAETQAAYDAYVERTTLAQKLARQFVEQGIKERDALINAVHAELQKVKPDITRRETMDAISGYGQYRQLSKDEISRELRDLKGQMQQVAKLADMEANRPPLKTGTERRVPSVEERRLIRLVNDAKNKFQVPITDEATQLKSSLDMLKDRLRNRITELEDKLVRKDFTREPKRVIQLDAEAQRLHFQAAKTKAKWHEALMKDRLARRTVPQKIIGGIGETVNTIRAIMTSGEFSGVLRQGGFTGLGNPARITKAFPALIKGFRSEAKQHAVNQEIMARPNYHLYVRSKLFLSEHGQKLSQMEEAYMSRWAGKVPVVAGTQRAHSTFLNKLRADSFDVLAKTLVRRQNELTPERARDIANFLNVSTGRGSLGVRGDSALVTMNTAFFAPRWVASRFQLLIGQPFWKPIGRKDWPVVRLIAEEYGKFFIAMGVIYGLWGMAGGEVETDPRSSDFGKLRTGDTRVDLMAGLQQQTVLVSRLASGETKKLSGKIVPIRGEDIPYRGDTSASAIGNFLRTKLAPVPASTLDMLTGKDVANQPVTPQSELIDLSTPLAYGDIYKAMIEQGVSEGTALALLAIFGAGLQTYDR